MTISASEIAGHAQSGGMERESWSARPVGVSAVALVLIAFVFAAVAGYGWLGVSFDYPNYLDSYKGLTTHYDPSASRFERGYTFSSWFCKVYLGLSFAQYYVLLAASSLLLKFRLLWRHTSAPMIAALVYLLLLYPLHEYTQIRVAVALAFAYTAIDRFLVGKWLTAVALFTLAALFHTTTLVLAAAMLVVSLARNRPPAMAATVFAGLAALSSVAISASVGALQNANPLVAVYLDGSTSHMAPNPFSGEVILLFTLYVTSAICLRPWRFRSDGVFYLLSLWSLILFYSLITLPTFAHRIEELFIFAFFLFTFRFDESRQSRVPAVVMILTGAWMLGEAWVEGLILL